MIEVTKKEFDAQLDGYRRAGLTVVEAPGLLGQTYYLATGCGWSNARVGRRTTCKWILDNPLNLR